MTDPFLALIDISKIYPGVVALDHVSFSVSRGEVIGLIGENGAGKSTLMKVMGGVTEPSGGTIRIDGVARPALTVAEAIGAGIAFVHQELNLFDNLDAAANVFIGREPLHGGPLRLIDRRKLHAAVQPLLDRLGVDFTPDTPVAEMSLAQRQLLEIVKALSLDARLVIMDEPTSSLTLSETDRLMNVIAGLKADGVGVIFIIHRLNEVRRCADRVVVLRDGRVVGALDRGEIAHDAHDPPDDRSRPQGALFAAGKAARPRASRNDRRADRRPIRPSRSTSLSGAARSSALAGLVGSGRSELARAVFGIDRLLGGAVRLDGEPIVISLATRRHRQRHLPGARGPQTRGPAARRLGCGQYLAARPAFLFPRGPHGHRERSETANAERQKRAAQHPDADGLDGRWQRSPAAISRRSCSPNGWRCDRASSSSTSRRAASTSAPRTKFTKCCARLADFGRRHIDDFQRHGGGDRGQRSHRRDA